jgi:hypothetical protein
MSIVRNTSHKRTSADPVWRRLYLLAKIEGAKTKLLAQLADLPPNASQRTMDKLIASHFTLKQKATKK